MKRYYYNDSLAAAWMAKHFGMRFEDTCEGKEQGRIGYNAGRYIFAECDDLFDHAENRLINLYLHPDSLPLLVPKVGDVIQRFEEEFIYYGLQTVVDDATAHKYCYESSAHINSFKSDQTGFRIIQRNGKPFHWPECEEA